MGSAPEADISPSSTHGFLPRLIGVIRCPRTTFRAAAAAPRWAGLVVALALATAASQAVLFATGVGQVALVDQWERTALAFGQDVDDARYADFQALSRNGPLYGVATALVSGPVLTVAVAALIFAVFRGKGGRTVSYSQVLAVMAHASVILAIRQIVSRPGQLRAGDDGERDVARRVVSSAGSGIADRTVRRGARRLRRSGGSSCWRSASRSCTNGRRGRWQQRSWVSTPAWRCCSQRP